MDKKDLLLSLKKRVDVVIAEIKGAKEKLERGPFRITVKKELEQLEKEKKHLISDMEKLKENKDKITDDIRIGLETFADKLQNKVRKISLEYTIKSTDIALVHDVLKKNNKSTNDYNINIEIQQLEDQSKKVLATRIITITNKKTEKEKRYPAGGIENTSWEAAFLKDIENNYFED